MATDLGDITIEPVDVHALGDDDLVRLNGFENVLLAETEPDDPPLSLELTRDGLRHHAEQEVRCDFWARGPDGTIAGSATALYWDVVENRNLVNLSMFVRPERRRRGIASALLPHLIGFADDVGRELAAFSTSERCPAGLAFAERLGARPGQDQHTNRLLLDGVDPDLVETWASQGPDRAPGYSLVRIDGRRYPDELIDDICEAHAIMNTAPRDGLELEDQVITPDVLRGHEASLGDTVERWSIFVRHEASGRLIGLTEVYYEPRRPHVVWQGDTGVHPDHRGHAIGKWIKAVMLERILRERPEAVDVRTGNADSNEPMLAINHQLGFRPFHAFTRWQVRVDDLRAYAR